MERYQLFFPALYGAGRMQSCLSRQNQTPSGAVRGRRQSPPQGGGNPLRLIPDINRPGARGRSLNL